MQGAIDRLNTHRLNEGAMMEKDLLLRINNIEIQQAEVIKLEPLRQQKSGKELHGCWKKMLAKKTMMATGWSRSYILYREDRHYRRAGQTKESLRVFQIFTSEKEEEGKETFFILQEIGRMTLPVQGV